MTRPPASDALPRCVRRPLLALAAGVFALPVLPAMAATITVDATCSLPDAVAAANGDVATAGCPAGSGADTIVLTVDPVLSVVRDSDEGGSGLPGINSVVTIEGNGHTVSALPGPSSSFRIADVRTGGDLILKNITISGGRLSGLSGGGAALLVRNGGRLTVIDSTVKENVASRAGGGIGCGSGFLTLTNSVVSGNSAATDGGGISALFCELSITGGEISGNTAGRSGGGISVQEGSTATIREAAIAGNRTSNGFGGGLALSLENVKVSVIDSRISGNASAGIGGDSSGGGVAIRDGGVLELTRTVVDGNITEFAVGGGIDCRFQQGVLSIQDSLISNNSAPLFGGGGIASVSCATTIVGSTIAGNSSNTGGGLLTSGSSNATPTSIINSTVSGNTAKARGGGVQNLGGGLIVRNSTITENTVTGDLEVGGGVWTAASSSTRISGSIVVGNDRGDVVAVDDAVGNFVSGGDNLIGTGNAAARFDQSGDQAGVADAGLGLLAGNGGTTDTHALLRRSPAIDAVTLADNCPGVDQRGVMRPQGVACDIGAYERMAVVQPVDFLATVRQPINPDPSDPSVFPAKRGVIPAKFWLQENAQLSCDLPVATIRLSGSGGPIAPSVYRHKSETGDRFRIDDCQYLYNIAAKGLLPGDYLVELLIDGQPEGSASFKLE